MKENALSHQNLGYDELVKNISEKYSTTQAKAASAVNAIILDAYWEIGRYIIEVRAKGKQKSRLRNAAA